MKEKLSLPSVIVTRSVCRKIAYISTAAQCVMTNQYYENDCVS